VYQATDPVLDAWHGMRGWLKQDAAWKGFFTKLEYEEMGASYLAEHFASNHVVEPRS
jgi:actin-related protein